MRKFHMWCALVVVCVMALAVPGRTQDAAGAGQPVKAAKANPAVLVNLNTATLIELQALPGVGPATAARIVEYREKNGSFKKIEDLMNIRGIGEKSFLKLRPLVTVAAPKPNTGR